MNKIEHLENVRRIEADTEKNVLVAIFKKVNIVIGGERIRQAHHHANNIGPREKLEICTDCFQYFSLRICIRGIIAYTLCR